MWLIVTDPLNVRLVVTSGLEWPPVALPLPLNKAKTERFMRNIQDEMEELRKSREGRYEPNVGSYISARFITFQIQTLLRSQTFFDINTQGWTQNMSKY